VKDNFRINNQIKENRITLILENGTMHGDINFEEAMNLADSSNLDLVEIVSSKNNDLSICKLMDYGKYKYKNEKKIKFKCNNNVVKEIRFCYNTSIHDLEIKNKKVIQFLKEKKQVKYVLMLKGREIHKRVEAENKMKQNVELFKDIANFEKINFVGNKLTIMLNPFIK
jgi:translation initiation factor IF-3